MAMLVVRTAPRQRQRRWFIGTTARDYNKPQKDFSRRMWSQDPLTFEADPDTVKGKPPPPKTQPTSRWGVKRNWMQRDARTRSVFEEKETIKAPRRDDFWRWGTLHIDRVPVLRALLDRMLPRRYHKWYDSTTYEHHWVGPEDSEDGETTELFFLVRHRGEHNIPSVLKFRMKEVRDASSDIKIMIDYQRVETNYLARWAVMICRDATTRLINEMDDWYAEMKAQETELLGPAASTDLDRLLPDALPSSPAPKAAARFKKVAGIAPRREGRWSAGLSRKERRTSEAAMYDPQDWDTKPLRATAWPIPRIDHEMPDMRDQATGKDTHL
eukprot:TRINITY_DN20406_c0_g1_i2.p1 TRINITY_DN20406_c0_g1~~TRINITY_DN20406_c0_g1_i2.p1  ORF type:complete len:327 (+),score=123.07 TRINITY_DN20406_c0_g1_i2:115-1095(+)